MPIYIYKVRDKEGKVLQGRMEAVDAKELRKKLDEKDYFIVEYQEKKSQKDILSANILSMAPKIKSKDLSIFSWQLYTMLDAGITLTKALKILENQIQNDHLRDAINDVWRRVEEGSAFSAALSEHPHIFSRLYVQLVNAGEVGGVLDEMLRRLAVYYERQDEIKNKIKSALTYPVALIVVSVGVVIFLVTFVLPRFSGMFSDLGTAVPLPTQLLLGLSFVMRAYWYLFCFAIVGLVGALKLYIGTVKGRFQLDQFKLRLPLAGELIQKSIASQFTQTLSTLISGGIPILTALEVVTDTIDNKVVSKAIKEVTVMVGEGKSIAKPLGDSGVFPEMVVDMIRVGEETGALDKMLEKVAQFYEREVDNAIEVFTKLIEPFLIIFMTAVIGFIALSIFLPMADILSGMHG